MKPVLVIDACQRSALAVTRSLGSHGISVITADETDTALAGSSRFSTSYHPYPAPSANPDAFIDAVAALCAQHGCELVFPMTEMTTMMLLENQHRLAGARLPFAAAETIESLADKCRLVELAASLDVPVPETQQCSAGELPENLEASSWPLVVKPGKSWLHTAAGWLHSEVRFAGDEAELREMVSSDPALNAHGFMLQQCVPGSGRGVFALYDRGEAVAFFAHRRLHEKPPRGGVSVICESVDPDPELLDYSKRLLDAVGWHGVAMVEFRADADRAWLMEINTRFWGSLQLAIDSGIDFPWLLYNIALGRPVQRPHDYRRGKRLRWWLGDLDWLYLVLKDRDYSLVRKLRALLSFSLWAPLACKHEVNRFSDMGPFRWELREYLRHIADRF